MQRRAKKTGKQNAVFRFILAKRDKDRIVAWNQDLFRILHVFNVRSMALLRIYELSPLSDRAGDRHQHEGCGCPNYAYEYSNNRYGYSDDGCEYLNDSCGYPSKHADGAERCLRPKPQGGCNLPPINIRIFTNCQIYDAICSVGRYPDLSRLCLRQSARSLEEEMR
jgi:hypothetical protein